MERRDFIKMLGLAGTSTAAYAACSAYMQKALAESTVIKDMLAADVHCEKGSLKDIEHVVILMQENRSFDHYYGTLRGVRGFGDPRPLKMRDGEPIWHQPNPTNRNQRIRPYHLANKRDGTDAGHVFLQDPDHEYGSGLDAWNFGWSDRWIENKKIVTMAHYVGANIPLYFKLAKAFTICDSTFCSHNGATDPNRSYFWTGTCDGRTSNTYFSSPGLPEASRPTWATYPERLEELGVDWKFYQDGLTWTNGQPFAGNYGDNTLEYFRQYRDKTTRLYAKNQTVNSVLRTKADEESQFERDIRDGTLPPISWIVPAEAYTEHPKFPPHFGEYYVNEILRAFLANKELWRKTVFLITYDENGGFFDHVLPPVPPLNGDMGKTSAGIVIPQQGGPRDFNSEQSVSGATRGVIGMGMRVPMLVISPWSAGGRVCSEVFDHTSVIQFLETWLTAKGKQPKEAPLFPNISSWRRAIAGDLTSAFDFDRTQFGPMSELVETAKPARVWTAAEVAKAKTTSVLEPDMGDVNNDPAAKFPVVAKQDRERCDILPIGYDFEVLASFVKRGGTRRLNFTFRNRGKLGVAFTVLSYDRMDGGWFYSVEGTSGEPIEISDSWSLAADLETHRFAGDYAYAIHGPNGYLGEFHGNSDDPSQQLLPDIVKVIADEDGKFARFDFSDWPTANGRLKVINAYTGEETTLENGRTSIKQQTRDGWYDVAFIDAATPSRYLRRYAGHMENGRISRSDPAIGMLYDEAQRVYLEVAA
jgi:phospholipase C